MAYGLGLLGTGYIARKHCEALRGHDRVRPVAVCASPRGAAAGAQLAARYGFEAATTDYDELLADPRVDVVLVCTPDALHADHAARALDGGKHVLVEKPLAVTEDGFEAIRERLDRAGTALQVGMNCRFRARYAALHELVTAGALGELRFLRGTYLANSVADARAAEKPWWFETPPGTFQLVHGGIVHCLDLVRWVGGELSSVFARGTGFELAAEWELDTFSVSFELENGAIGELLSSFAAFRPDELALEAWLEGGAVLGDALFRRDGDTLAADAVRLETEQRRPDLALELDDLIAAVEAGTQPLNSVDEAYRNFRALTAIERSLRSGEPVPVSEAAAAADR